MKKNTYDNACQENSNKLHRYSQSTFSLVVEIEDVISCGWSGCLYAVKVIHQPDKIKQQLINKIINIYFKCVFVMSFLFQNIFCCEDRGLENQLITFDVNVWLF